MTRDLRFRIDPQGRLEIVDPGFDSLALLQTVDPGFVVREAPLEGFSRPRFRYARAATAGIAASDLTKASTSELWALHAMQMGLSPRARPRKLRGFASLLELKIELARRLMQACALCARRCGVDRTRGELGVCRLGADALVSEHFVHVAEEAPINPSLVLNLAGCGLRCRFCQQWRLLEPGRADGERLDASLWRHLDRTGARSLSFVGGNPDESLYAILRFLQHAPRWSLPVVWNNHAFSTPEVLTLLDGVVDAYIPDLKYGSDLCGRALSGISSYPDTAIAAIGAMVAQGVPVIVRILVLPGHVDCCHIPALERLRTLRSSNLTLSIRDQYCPDWQVTPADLDLSRRPYASEIEQVRNWVLQHGLKLVADHDSPRGTVTPAGLAGANNGGQS